MLPKLKAEKIKSFDILIKTIGNKLYIQSVFQIINDSIERIRIINNNEKYEKQLYYQIKEIFTLLNGFLMDGIIYPCCQAATIQLLRKIIVDNNLTIIHEYLDILSWIYWTINQLNTFFQSIIVSNSLLNPNNLLICKETKRNSLKIIEKSCNESLHAWILWIGNYLDKNYLILQQKNDYNITINSITAVTSTINSTANSMINSTGIKTKTNHMNIHMVGTVPPTSTCDNICKMLLKLANYIQKNKNDLFGNLTLN